MLTGGSTSRPRKLLDWIPRTNWFWGITGWRFWITFIIPVHDECWIQNQPYLKNSKIAQKNSKNHFRTLRIFWDDTKNNFSWVYRDDLESTISQKLKIAKIGKLIFIRFRTLRVILDQKIITALFEGGRGWVSACRQCGKGEYSPYLLIIFVCIILNSISCEDNDIALRDMLYNLAYSSTDKSDLINTYRETSKLFHEYK